MAKTRQEIRGFLDSLVGQSVNDQSGQYKGQCVSLIKALLDFIGIANPYMGRGDATNVDNALLNQGIANNGRGWLTIVVNHDMGFIDGVHYGHIWIDLLDEANYEQNGNRALVTTKNTRPISQGQQFINLDKWIQKENTMNKEQAEDGIQQAYLLSGEQSATREQIDYHTPPAMADPGYLPALMHQLYLGKTWQNMAYKAGHYEEDIEKARASGNLPAGSYLKVDQANIIEVK